MYITRLAAVVLSLSTADALAFGGAARALPPLRRAHARGITRTAPIAAAETDEETAQEKKLKAERLKLEAERAALEAEKLELEMRQRLAERKANEPEQEEEEEAAPPPVVGTTANVPAATPAAEEKESSGAFGLNVSSIFGAPPGDANAQTLEPPPLTFGSIAEVINRKKDEEALQLSDAQVAACRESVFGTESFYVTKVDKSYVGTIFRGNLRCNASEACALVLEAANRAPSLVGVRLLLLDDPIAPTLDQLQPGVDTERRPVFLALPAEATVLEQTIPELVVGILCLITTFVTTLGFALSTYLLSDGGRMLAQLEAGDASPLDVAFPIAIGTFLLQGSHELGHLLAASKYNMKLAAPVLLPSLQLGTFGCLTRLTAFPPTRQALFDFALAGPALGFSLSLVVFCFGVLFSVPLPVPELPDANIVTATAMAVNGASTGVPDAGFATAAAAGAAAAGGLTPIVPSALIQTSLLCGSIAGLVLPALSESPAVALDPLAIIGFVGVLTNALQLLPIGRLDGGRLASAVFGQSNAGLISGVSLLLLGLSTLFSGDNPILLFFGLVIIFVQRSPELPCRDDITGVDDTRKAFATVAFAVALITLTPMAQVATSTSSAFF